MPTVTTLQGRLLALLLFVFVVGVLLVLVVTGHADSGTLALFTSPLILAIGGAVLGAQLSTLKSGVDTAVHQTNGLLRGPLAAIQSQAEANGAKLDALPGVLPTPPVDGQ